MTDNPAALFDVSMFEITGALLMQDIAIMPMPIPRAMRRERQGVVRRGKDSRHDWGDTSGEGSDDQAQFAMLLITGLFLIASMLSEDSGGRYGIASLSSDQYAQRNKNSDRWGFALSSLSL